MKVVWIQDFNIITDGGGAQMTDRHHYLEGVRRGHDMNLCTPQTPFSMDELNSDTLVMASNPTFWNPEQFQELQKRNIRYAYFFHDYWPVCKWRLFYPMEEECKSCYLLERWLSVLEQASLLIWLSPLHRNAWIWLCPSLANRPYMLSPSPVDPDKFYPMDLQRNGVIAVESLHPFKGREAVLEWVTNNPGIPVTIIGGNSYPLDPLPPNVTYYEFVPQGQLNELYNKHQALLHLPVSPSPYDRTVAEAYLSGCDIIGNKLIGALSWDWFKDRESVAERSRISSTHFWDNIEHGRKEGWL